MTMTDLIALVNQISTSVKVSWAVWLAWALIQIEWYRRGRTFESATYAAPTPFRPDRQQVLPLRSWSDSPVWEPAGSADSTMTVTDGSMPIQSAGDHAGEPAGSRRRSRRSQRATDEQPATSESESTEPVAHAS
jgi:hypothetical protein